MTNPKHTNQVKGTDLNNKQIAENIGNLYYDSLADLLKELSFKIACDGDADFKRGRKKLAKELHDCAANLEQASRHIDRAWAICKPYTSKAGHQE